ncbi:putative staphylococcal-like nuclease CAN3 isoform X2 [Carex rostrata]
MVLVILQAFNLMLRIIAHAVVLAYNILSFFVTSLIQKQVSGPSSWPEGVQFELHTLPVHAKLIGDGDGMIVHVNIKDMRESGAVPIEVQEAAIKRRQARAIRDYVRADALHKSIMSIGLSLLIMRRFLHGSIVLDFEE